MQLSKIKKLFGVHRRYLYLFIIVSLFYLFIFYIVKTYEIKQEDIRKIIEPYGAYGIFALFFLQLLFSLTPLPDGAMPIIALITYSWQGLIVIFLAHYITSVMQFALAKKLGRNIIEKKFPLIKKYTEGIKENNTIVKLVYIRVFSIVSFDIAAYVAGISNVDIKTFSIAAIIGLIPTNAILIIVSSGLFAETTFDYLNIAFWLLISLSLLAFLYKKSKINN